MTARDEMAVLLSKKPSVGKWNLDAIASLATDPETAPVVFRWLVEAGVLAPPDEPCDCTDAPMVWNVPGIEAHYHAVLGERHDS